MARLSLPQAHSVNYYKISELDKGELSKRATEILSTVCMANLLCGEDDVGTGCGVFQLPLLAPGLDVLISLCLKLILLAASIRSGITKQMSWKPSCKTGSANWAYNNVCSDPTIFGMVLKFGGPPMFKAKKYTPDEFHDAIGYVHGSVRYNDLYVKGSGNVRWPGDGTLKISGSYGI